MEYPKGGTMNITGNEITPKFLRSQAAKCRRLANLTDNEAVIQALTALADEYEAQVDELGADPEQRLSSASR
jgi:hypothetical protein